MEQSELIHRFIDEGLDPITEQNLFESMAKNPSLRSEFKQYLSFERAALTDFSAYQPSIGATNAIFSNLGISTVAATSTAANVAATSFWAKYSGLFFTNIASAIITAALFYFFNMQNSDNGNIYNPGGNTQKPNIEQSNQIPIVSNNVLKSNAEEIKPVKEKIKYVYIQKKDEDINLPVEERAVNEDQNSLSDVDLNLISATNFNKRNLENPISPNEHLRNSNVFEKIDAIQMLPSEYAVKNIGLDNVSVMFTGNDSYSLPQSPLPRSSQPIFDSKSLILMYDLNPNFAIGVDVRQEFYYLDYTGQIESKEFRYEQNTNFTSVGIVGKWNWLNYNNFKSFANLYLGGNQIGQIGRFMIGTEISPSKEYGFIIGVEGSLLRHLHQNEEFFAKKIGLNYGIIFHF